MAVFRVNKNKDFTVMSNYHLRDENLSLKAKGLLSQMLSLPDKWDYSVNGLCAINKESIKAIRSVLNELEQNNYLVRTRTKDKNGRFDYVYDIYEKPYTQKGHAVEGHAVEGHALNGLQLNKEKLNKEKLNKDYIRVSQESQDCAKKLRDKILEIYPNNVGARKKDCVERWAKDIDKMNRLDGRSWEDIEKAIDWAIRDNFWQKNIWSGANLRKHYDRIEADARAKFMKHGTITVGL